MRNDDGLRNHDIRLRMLQEDPQAFGGSMAQALRRPDDYGNDLAADLASATQCTLFVADDGDRWQAIAGGILQEAGTAVEIVAVWIDPAFRWQGLARKLIEQVMGWAQDRGVVRAFLWVIERNYPAMLLYERLEFTRQPDRTPWGEDGKLMQILMSRTIA